MLEEDGKEFNKRWGYLSRAGLNDKSQFTRQIEKYAGEILSTPVYLWRPSDVGPCRACPPRLPHGSSMCSKGCCARSSEDDKPRLVQITIR